MAKAPITAVVITKNEGPAIRRCLEAASFCEQILVIDSQSTDDTVEIARSMGAEVIPYTWNGKYPKKKQWGMSHPSVRHDWVLHLDADEVVTPELAKDIQASIKSKQRNRPVAYDIDLAYHFLGRELRHGHRVAKRSLVNRLHVEFPEVDDLAAPGITEVEGHYQPRAHGPVGRLNGKLRHDDPDPLADWVSRHNKYSDWEAFLRNSGAATQVRGSRSRQGQIFDLIPAKPAAFFIYSYIFRLGFLDGAAGFHYAFALSWYYWLTSVKTNEIRKRSAT